jgi:uncharacterized protein YecT (DUF1311 family)
MGERMLFKALPLMLALVAVPAFAAPVPVKPPVKLTAPADPCAKAMNGKDRAACMAPVLDAATQSLDATEAQIKTHFKAGEPYAALFDSAHDGWVKEMNQTCHAAEQFYAGGDISYSIGIDCQIQMTRDREKLLKTLYSAPLNH